MRACQIINPLRTLIRLPDDVALLERINHLATQRLNDTDREVVAAARLASDSQKRVFILDRDPSHDHPSAQVACYKSLPYRAVEWPTIELAL